MSTVCQRTVYFLPVRLSTTVSVPRPPPGAGLSSTAPVNSAVMPTSFSWRVSTASLDAATSEYAILSGQET